MRNSTLENREEEQPGNTDETLPLSELLAAHKQRLDLGDARIATLASDRVGIANFVTRSSVRNWASGRASRVNNWRQIAAVASALQLDRTEADRLMRAGGCDSITDLLRVVLPADEVFLAYWRTNPDAVVINLTTTEPAGVAAAPEPVAVAETVADPVAETVPETVAKTVPETVADTGAVTGTDPNRSRGPLLLLLTAAVIGAALLALTLATNGSNSPELTAVEPSPEVHPATQVLQPVNGTTLGGDLVASGTASHPDGIDRVEIIVKDQTQELYWNPVDGSWDINFTRFIVPIAQGERDVTWNYDMPVALPSNDYRVRAWSFSVHGVIDPNGPQSNFVVENINAVLLEDGAAANPDGPNPLGSVVEDPNGKPVSTIAEPTQSPTGSNTVVSGTSAHASGIAEVQLIFRQLDGERYWDPVLGAWIPEFQRFSISVDDVGAASSTWSWELPAGLDPGRYRVRVWGVPVEGLREDAYIVTDFSVTE